MRDQMPVNSSDLITSNQKEKKEDVKSMATFPADTAS